MMLAVYGAAQVGREREERDDVFPARATGLGDHRVLLAPSVVKGLERLGGGFGVDGAVDGLEIGGDALAVLVDDVAHSRSNLVDDARLHARLGEDGLDRVREPGQPSRQATRTSWTPG
jgi:hypothetical protein